MAPRAGRRAQRRSGPPAAAAAAAAAAGAASQVRGCTRCRGTHSTCLVIAVVQPLLAHAKVLAPVAEHRRRAAVGLAAQEVQRLRAGRGGPGACLQSGVDPASRACCLAAGAQVVVLAWGAAWRQRRSGRQRAASGSSGGAALQVRSHLRQALSDLINVLHSLARHRVRQGCQALQKRAPRHAGLRGGRSAQIRRCYPIDRHLAAQ